MNGHTGGGFALPAPDDNLKKMLAIPEEFRVPDTMEATVAYRSWVITNGVLTSHNGVKWTPHKELRAECGATNVGAHKNAPGGDCTCGIYAANDEAIRNVPLGGGYLSPGEFVICGEVYLWGKIQEGPRGYRAQFAYPKRFFVRSHEEHDLVQSLGFGVPITLVRGRRTMEFPFPMSRRLRVQRSLLHYSGGLPLLVLASLDVTLWDMSRWYNQVMISVLFFLGLVGLSLPFILRWQIRRILR